ncbi:hypothetical protein JJC03_09120 [Flavobacterium oreochromis]|uniref:hypothetical protein n=1 Tax=Flavobacterium oreochromis TaxID=2906078 RepID=UPI001CE712EB|nr:hypothetical protein [Flavobacterium oreochromis]QYS85399.1 hypothetical protein JJC03_09120 [Flavobacterium oreochromis]
MKELDFSNVLNNLAHWELFIIVLIVVISYYYRNAIAEIIKAKSILKKKKDIANLVQHDFFNTTVNVRNEIMRIDFATNGEVDMIKTKLLHHLIKLKTTEIEASMTAFLKRPDLNECSSQGLRYLVKSNLFNIVNNYTIQAERDFIRCGITVEDARFVINSYEDFRQEVVDGFVQRVESITTNDDYFSNYDKMSAILEVVAISLFLIPKDAKNAFDKINGRFKKYQNVNLDLLG